MPLTSRAPRPDFSFTGSVLRAGVLGLLLLSACSSSDPPPAVIAITTGAESDAWTLEPAPRSVFLEMVQGETRTPLATVAAPATDVAIGSDAPSNIIASFEATAFDGDANVVMAGASVPLYLVVLTGKIPLFMGRVGGFSRAPGELLFARQHPQLLTLSNDYLLISGGDGAQTNPVAFDVYSTARWTTLQEQPALPKVPESWAAVDPKILLIDHAGAIWLDLSTSSTSSAEAPLGLDFAQIVGGDTLTAPDGTQYIVGATRTTGEPTNQIARVGTDGSLQLMRLGTARLGAAATMVNGQLLVVGGSDTGPGAEASNVAGTTFIPLPFPADARRGSAIVALDSTTAVLAGGRDPETDEIAGIRTMDLGCTEDCAQEEIADFAFDRPRLFWVREGQLLAVGEQPDSGETRVFTFDTGIGHALAEVALRTPRSGASAYLLPNGQVAILGGETLADQSPAVTLELFFAQP